MDSALRNERLHSKSKSTDGDGRTFAQKDRDRLLYTSALRRLTEVTQVVSADNAHVFHNRLTHSLQVAQVGRRIAEHLCRTQPDILECTEGLDPDVVEAACLAHDLGHPPFGHTAEEELDRLAGSSIGGYEGNAQSFRIVTKLAFKSPNHRGLDLTRATLAALLKYPWKYGGNPQYPKKWGAYESEDRDFRFARALVNVDFVRTAEADLMDWADDVTYSVHDLEDFYRAGRIPLHLLANRRDDRERRDFFDDVFQRRADDGGIWKKFSREDLEEAFTDLVVTTFTITKAYTGTKEQRAKLRSFSARLIHRFIEGIKLRCPDSRDPSRTERVSEQDKEVAMLKELTWTYVISAPSLAASQRGQKEVISKLFEILIDAAMHQEKRAILPVYYKEQIEASQSEEETRRLVTDLIAGMTEQQAFAMYQRLAGISYGPSLEDILK